MIIEDACEQQTSPSGRTKIGDSFVFKGVAYKREQLVFGGFQCGDYTNEEHDFLVERKEADDFVSSVLDGRLYEQLAKMHDYYEGYRELIFVGDWDTTIRDCFRKDATTGTHTAQLVQSARLRLQPMGVQWFQAWDESDAATEILFLDKYAKGIKNFEVKQPKHQFHVRDERVKLLMMFPNIGTRKKVDVLLEKYKTIETIIEYAIQHPKEMEKELKGTRIGKDTIDKISDITTSKKEVHYETRTSEGTDISEGNNVLSERPKKVYGAGNFYRRRKDNKHAESP